MVLLTAENIKKAYGERVILKEVSLYINDTDKIGIVGVNGEGKSTLLKILSGRSFSNRPEKYLHRIFADVCVSASIDLQ